MSDLVERLRGIYRMPITDGLGSVGSGNEPDNPYEFVRTFPVPPIHREAAAEKGIVIADPEARETIYGMPYKEWQAIHQKEASAQQLAEFAKANPGH